MHLSQQLGTRVAAQVTRRTGGFQLVFRDVRVLTWTATRSRNLLDLWNVSCYWKLAKVTTQRTVTLFKVEIRPLPPFGWLTKTGIVAPDEKRLSPGRSFRPKCRSWLLGICLAWGSYANGALPGGWLDTDIGSPGLAGSASYNNGTWSVSGGGKDVCSSDQSHFVYKPLSGDATITAQVVNLANAPFGEAGVILRNDLTQGAIEVSVLATTNNGVTFQWRSSPGVSCSYQVAIGYQNLSVPVWVQLVRSGNSFSGYLSTNGVDFVQIGSTQIVPMNVVALGGLTVSAGDNAALALATLANVSIPPPVFGIYRELWTGLSSAPGNTLAALTNTTYNPNWPDNPNTNYTSVYTAFETETNTGMNYYGQRLRTFVVPPLSGNYTFWIARDDT